MENKQGRVKMNEERIQELKRHRDFARSLYKIAGNWGDVQYMKLNSLVEFLEDELTELGIDKYEEREKAGS